MRKLEALKYLMSLRMKNCTLVITLKGFNSWSEEFIALFGTKNFLFRGDRKGGFYLIFLYRPLMRCLI